jgi:PKD repeat protein
MRERSLPKPLLDRGPMPTAEADSQLRNKEGTMARKKRVDSKRILSIILFFTVCLLSGPALLAQDSISFTPSGPNVEEAVAFTLTPPGRISGTVQWDFGDGSTASGGTTISHKYLSTGSFVVKATVTVGGRPNTTQTKVAVSEKRKISSTPSDPKTGEKVAFQAKNFLTSSIQWDFGDRTTKTSGPNETHAYTRPGTFTVTATDLRGTSCCPVAILVTVKAAEGGRTTVPTPSVQFTIASVRVRFEDGKDYVQVPKDFKPLLSYADVKYEGSGNLEAQWLLDGKPFKSVSLSLASGKQQTIDSGADLPTEAPGAHEVTLKITKPQVPFTPPTVRYLVLLEGAEVLVSLDMNEARDKETGGLIVIDENRLVLSQGRDYLFKGTIKNMSGQPIPSILVFIMLDGKNLDQKRLTNLKPGEARAFETSILNETGVQKRLIFEAFETSAKERLLARREFTVLGGGVQLPRPPARATPAPEPPSAPTITSLSPESVEAGSGAIDPLTVNGSGFDPEAVVRVREAGVTGTGTNYTPLSVAPDRILVTIPESWTSEAKSLEIRVQNPDGSGGWVNSDWFPFQVKAKPEGITSKAQAPPSPRAKKVLAGGKEAPSGPMPNPIIFSINPDSVLEDSGRIAPLMINGDHFIREGMSTTIRLRRVSAPSGGPPGAGVVTPISVSPTEVKVNVDSSWTNEGQLIEVRVLLRNDAGDSIESNDVLLRVMGKIVAKEPPSGIKDIDILPPIIASVSPTAYIRGAGTIEPLVIEGSSFYHTPDVFHYQRVVVLLRYPGGEKAIFETPFDLSLDSYPGVSPSRIECSASIDQSLAHKATSLEVQVRLDVTTYTAATATHYYSNPVPLTCLGTRATIATLSPNRIDVSISPPTISIFPPDIPMFYGMFYPDCVISVRPEGENAQVLTPVQCERCNKLEEKPRIEFALPSQMASRAQDLEIKVGNPEISGGRIWSNSLILPVGEITSRLDIAQCPGTEITTPSYFLGNTEHKGFLYGRPPYKVEFQAIKKDQDILGFEYAITEGANPPPDNPANPVYKWLNSSAKSVDLRDQDFYDAEAPDEGRWSFWIRAVDIEGRRDPTPAVFPIIIDRVVSFSVTFTKVRVDNDADPPGNPSEVRFHAGAGLDEGVPALREGCRGSSADFPREFETDQTCTHGAGKFKIGPNPVWVMGNGDSRDIQVYLNCQNILPEKIQDRGWHLTIWGRECDDGPYYYEEQSLGETTINFSLRATSDDESPKGYFLFMEGLKYPFPTGEEVKFMKSIEGKDGAFTVWYTFRRED